MIPKVRHMIRVVLPVLVAAGGALPGAGAQELEIVTVVGKRAEPLHDAAAAVSVITAADLEAALASDLRDALRNEPGVAITRDPQRFGTGGPIVRGLGGNRVLVETDGVPAAKTFAVGSFSNTGRQFADLAIVERIELLRGPASALYGSDAIAGVVAITTLDPSDLLHDDGEQILRTRAGYAGDDDSIFAGFTAAARSGSFQSLLAYAHRDGNELEHAGGGPPSNPRDYDSDALLARVAWAGPGPPLRLTVEWNQERNLTDVDSLELSGGRFANTILMQGDDHFESLRLLLDQNFAVGGQPDQGLWRAYWQESELRQLTHEERRAVPPATPPLAIDRGFHYRERVAGAEVVLARDLATAGGPHRLTSGIEFAETRVIERREGLQTNLATGAKTSTILGESLPVRDFPLTTIREAGVYVQDEWRPGNGRWSLIPALRADWYRLEPSADAMYAQDNPDTPPVMIDQGSLSPKLGIGWRARDDIALFLQYAHGYRSPPFDDVNIGLDLPQFKVRAIPNPDLEPERSDSLEVGIRLSGAAASGTLSVYGSRYRDFIESRVNIGVDADTGTTLFQSRNIASAEIWGAEAALDLVPGAWNPALANWTGRIALAWTEGEDTVRDVPLNSIDPARGLLGLRYEMPSGRFGIGLDLTLVAAKHEVDETAATLFRPDGYTVADLRLQWRWSDRLTLELGLFNLTDRAYYEWSTVRGRTAGDPLLPLYREPGRNAAVTFSASFD